MDKEETKINYTVLLHTAEYRGDHEADVCIIHETKEGETLNELVERVLAPCVRTDRYGNIYGYSSFIEIRPNKKAL